MANMGYWPRAVRTWPTKSRKAVAEAVDLPISVAGGINSETVADATGGGE